MVLLIITLVLVLFFLLNFVTYWILFLKTERKRSKFWDSYTKIYLFLWSFPLLAIPILTSSFLEPYFGTISFFREYWLGFLFAGIIFLGLGIKLGRSTLSTNKIRGLAKGNYRLITDGPYEIVRHPMYAAWASSFIGLAMICDSYISLIIWPFLLILLGFEGYLEEKLLLIPKFGEKYKEYKKKVPNRIFPPPYNAILVLFIIFTIYIGFLTGSILLIINQ